MSEVDFMTPTRIEINDDGTITVFNNGKFVFGGFPSGLTTNGKKELEKTLLKVIESMF
jgi:hypothetical protein